MTSPVTANPVLTFELTDAESASLRDLAGVVARCADGRLDEVPFVNAVRAHSEDVPPRARQVIRSFRRHPSNAGVLLIRGVAVPADLPETPVAAGSVQREASVPSASLALIALSLGEPVAFASEKSGALVQDVVPVPALADTQSNGGSTALSLHVENAFHQHRPDYVLLLCLRSDPHGTAALRVAAARQVFPLLKPEDEDALRQDWYVTEPPPSFRTGAQALPPHAVLCGEPEDPDIRVDFNATRGIGPKSAAALERLREAMELVVCDVNLRPGDLAVVDNRLALHGRTRFQPMYRGNDRWLQRMYVNVDLRRSRPFRSDDGHVLTE